MGSTVTEQAEVRVWMGRMEIDGRLQAITIEVVGLPARPAVRTTQRGKWSARSREYQAAKKELGRRVYAESISRDCPPFAKDVPLAIRIDVWRRPERTLVNGKSGPYWRTTHPGRDADLGNIVKGVEDALQGVCYQNDRQIRQYLPCSVQEGDEDRIEVHIERIAGRLSP